MIYEKRYLQFNNLVFDGYDMLSDYSEDISFKGSGTSYSYGDGEYMPFKNDRMWLEAKPVNMTLTLKTKKLPCEYREFYVKFAEQELARPGRLWAIKNNEIIWAYAYVSRISPIVSLKQNEVVYDIEFRVYEGKWHKADKLKTFVLPYDVCLFMECKGYKKIDPCEDPISTGDCCKDCLSEKELKKAKNYEEDCFCCCVDQICNDMALCYHTDRLQEFYGCDIPYQLVYDCGKAELYNNGEPLGQKLCTKDACSNVIAGRFYSETDLSTDGVTIVIQGKVHDPQITINGNMNIIKGDYEGLQINPDGSVYEVTECCDILLSANKWSVPKGMDYGWTIYPQNNSIIVDLGTCCSRACVYIQEDAITA